MIREQFEEFFNKYRGEFILILLALISTGISAVIAFRKTSPVPTVLAAAAIPPISPAPKPSPHLIAVEVSGAVVDPDVYLVHEGTHLKDVIELAGDLSDEADRFFVARNFNMAKLVVDQEKIYVPYSWDISNEIFTEEKRVLNYLQPVTSSPQQTSDARPTDTITVSINTASLEELDALSGVGPVTAQKIIDSRPYQAVDDLVTKKVLNATTFEKIKDTISL